MVLTPNIGGFLKCSQHLWELHEVTWLPPVMKHGWKIPQQYFDHFLRNFPAIPAMFGDSVAGPAAVQRWQSVSSMRWRRRCPMRRRLLGLRWDSCRHRSARLERVGKKTTGSGQNQAISLDKSYVYCWSVLLHGCMRNHEGIYIEFNWCTSYIHTDAGIIKAKKKDTMETTASIESRCPGESQLESLIPNRMGRMEHNVKSHVVE